MDSQEEQMLNDMHHEYFDDLVLWCRNYVRFDSELLQYAEDWVQEAFFRAIKDTINFTTHENKKGWLTTTCKHIASSALKMRVVRDKHIIYYIDSPNAPPIEGTSGRIEDWENNEEGRAAICKVVSLLTKNEADVFNDYFLEGLSQAEIAIKRGKSLVAIRSTIRRIRRKALSSFRNINLIFILLFSWPFFDL